MIIAQRMVDLGRWIELVLSGQEDLTIVHRARGRWIAPIVALISAGMVYGAAMGSFDVITRLNALQMLYSAVKVPLLLGVTFVLSLPLFFVLNTLLGTRDDFAQVLRSLIVTQAVLTIILASFAPLTLFWYLSWGRYDTAVLFNVVMFGGASLASQVVLKRCYTPLIAANPIHRNLVRVWLVIYAFVGIQMGWVLRPFIGTPGLPVRFLSDETWGNAYVKVGTLVWRVMGG